MRRRDFIAGLGGAVAARPLAALAQQPAIPVIGYLSGISSSSGAGSQRAFLKGLGETGYVEGRNNLVLSAHARGLGSCWIGAPMLWLRSPRTRKELGIADAFTPFAAFSLGYAASVPQPRPRERPEIVASRNARSCSAASRG
jgi:nitroreductase